MPCGTCPSAPRPCRRCTPEPGRRRALTAWAGLATLAVVGSVAALTLPGTSGEPTGRDKGSLAADPTTPPARTTVPAGQVLVGVGHVAVAVPEAWLDGESRCDSAQSDDVLVETALGASLACAMGWGRDVTQVLVDSGDQTQGRAGTAVEADGVAARRSDLTCGRSVAGSAICSASLYVPSEDVTVRVTTSRSGADATAAVETVLAGVRVLPSLVAVPPWWTAVDAGTGDFLPTLEGVVSQLERAGFTVTTELQPASSNPGRAGMVTGVSPRPGTMLTPGSTVVVTAVRATDGPPAPGDGGLPTPTP